MAVIEFWPRKWLALWKFPITTRGSEARRVAAQDDGKLVSSGARPARRLFAKLAAPASHQWRARGAGAGAGFGALAATCRPWPKSV